MIQLKRLGRIIIDLIKTDRKNKDMLSKSNDDKLSESLSYPMVVIEESFIMEGKTKMAPFKIRLDVPALVDIYADKKEIEDAMMNTEETFRPIVLVLRHYLCGLYADTPDRFIMGRDNLIAAIKQCAVLQLRSMEENEKNR